MSDKKEARKAALQSRLVEAAETLIARNGLLRLKARDVTREAGCALGALYNAFPDLDRLILQVNGRTFARLGQILRNASAKADETPEAKLDALATAYAEFALAEPELWSALFNHQFDSGEILEWYLQAQAPLIELIVPPLSGIVTDLPQEALTLRAHTFFAAAHGVVQLSAQERLVGIPRTVLIGEVRALIQALCRGSRKENV